MDPIKLIGQKLLPQIEKEVRKITKEIFEDYFGGLKEIKELAAALTGTKVRNARGKGRKGKKMSKAAKAKIARAMKKAWARRKGRKSAGRKKSPGTVVSTIKTEAQ